MPVGRHHGERERDGGRGGGEARKRKKRQVGGEEQETQQRQERNEIQVANIEQALVFASAENTCWANKKIRVKT